VTLAETPPSVGAVVLALKHTVLFAICTQRTLPSAACGASVRPGYSKGTLGYSWGTQRAF
jgi:hypothetical protein